MTKRDAIIIGAGPAGLSAALWCAELGLDTVLLERGREIGGQLLWIYNSVENHLGARVNNGRELRDVFAAQIKNSKFQLRTEAEIVCSDLQAKRLRLRDGEELEARAVIIATGLRRRRLNVPGEREFAGRGVVESGRGEREFLVGKNVCVIGGGDAAAENALLLAEVCPRVTLIARSSQLRARRTFVEKTEAHPRINVLYDTTVRRITGESEVEAVEVACEKRDDDSAQTLFIEARGVVVRIGYEPNSEFVREQIRTDKKGYITVTSETEASIENVFAVGDISNPRAPTISGAIGAGATAAKAIASALAIKNAN